MGIRRWVVSSASRARILFEWVLGIAAGLLLIWWGTVLDARQEPAAAVILFLLASIALAAPLALGWKRRPRG